MTIRSAARWLLSEQLIGMIDYYRFPDLRDSWGGPFNGQKSRVELFHALMERFAPEAIIETGTYQGTTAEFLAGFNRPVFTIEGHGRTYGFARARLRKFRNVTLLHGDSRQVLNCLFSGPLQRFSGRTLFFYLDAHWNADLPLAQELDVIFRHCPRAVVMIDDFAVPCDPAYVYDDYGPGKALTPEYLAPMLLEHRLVALYPATPGESETGARRGCVVLASANIYGAALMSLPLLRPALTSV